MEREGPTRVWRIGDALEGGPSQTRRAVLWLLRAASAGRVYCGAQLCLGLLGVLALARPNAGALGLLMLGIPLLGIVLAFGLIGLAFLLMGVVLIARGRGEFGPLHRDRVQRGTAVFVLAAAAAVASQAVGAFALLAGGFARVTAPSGQPAAGATQAAPLLAASGVLAFAAVVLVALALVGCLRELAPSPIRGRWFMGLVLVYAALDLALVLLAAAAPAHAYGFLASQPLTAAVGVFALIELSGMLREVDRAVSERPSSPPERPAADIRATHGPRRLT